MQTSDADGPAPDFVAKHGPSRPTGSTEMYLPRAFATAMLCLSVAGVPITVSAQGTTFTYQGRLNAGTSPANGTYDLQFAIYDASANGNLLAGPVTNSATVVSNGLFLVTLDFGSGPFVSGAPRWLDIAVRTNSGGAFTELAPRQNLTATPYAILAGNISGVLPTGGLSGTYTSPVTFNNPGDTFAGNGTGLTALNASQLTSGTVPAAALGNAWKIGGNTGTSPSLGNFVGTTDFQPLELKAGGMRVLRLEPDSRTNVGGLSGNLIGGFINNAVEQPGSGANFIGSGGYPAGPNIIHSNAQGVFIGAGSANQIGPTVNDAFIGAGYGNTIQAFDGVIGGGVANTIGPNAIQSFLGGGTNNNIQAGASYSTLAGGTQNTIQSNATFAFIGGGVGNVMQQGESVIGGGHANIMLEYASVIGGGESNVVQKYADHSVIGGGGGNNIGGSVFNPVYDAVGGGYSNAMQSDVIYSTIGGGFMNQMFNNAHFSTIGGGSLNSIAAGALSATIGGGAGNSAFGYGTVVPGGIQNSAYGDNSFAAGNYAAANHKGAFVWSDASSNVTFASTTSNQFSIRALGGARFVTGGAGLTLDGQPVSVSLLTTNDSTHAGIFNVLEGAPVNFIAPGTYAATISGGGAANYFGTTSYSNTVAADFGTVAGGGGNAIQTIAVGATIGGGRFNVVGANGIDATIGGGNGNSIQAISYNNNLGGYNATIAGGLGNTIESPYATISGGSYSTIGTNSNSGTIGGGYYQNINNNSFDCTIGGGSYHAIGTNSFAATIAGGSRNTISDNAYGSTVGGGYYNLIPAAATYATVAGGLQNNNGGPEAVIGGGEYNFIGPAAGVAVIAGGNNNTTWSSSSIGGGGYNYVGFNSLSTTISGGYDNTINDNTWDASVGGGSYNTIGTNSFYSRIGGGRGNAVGDNSTAATIAGGIANSNYGNYAAIPGGSNNIVTGQFSFAAGQQAQALHDGAFVWADAQNGAFASTSPNEFLVRASGGVGINTNNPAGAALNVAGTVRAAAFQGDGSGLINVGAGALGNYVFAFNTATLSVATADTFQDISLSDSQLNGWSHSPGTAGYTNNQGGLYLIQYTAGAFTANTTGTNVSLRATLNQVEIPGSQAAAYMLFSPVVVTPVSKSFIAAVNATDVLTLQFTGSSTASRLIGAGFGISRPSVSLTITRIQ